MPRRPVTHVLFELGVVIKGLDGVLETIGGVLLYFVRPEQIHAFVRALTEHELSQDPGDPVATYLRSSTHDLAAGTKAFAAAYLVWHGLVKVGLVAMLIRRRLWAYPTAIAAFGLFLIYQAYRYSRTGAPELVALSILDCFVIGLTWLEYRRLKAAVHAS